MGANLYVSSCRRLPPPTQGRHQLSGGPYSRRIFFFKQRSPLQGFFYKKTSENPGNLEPPDPGSDAPAPPHSRTHPFSRNPPLTYLLPRSHKPFSSLPQSGGGGQYNLYSCGFTQNLLLLQAATHSTHPTAIKSTALRPRHTTSTMAHTGTGANSLQRASFSTDTFCRGRTWLPDSSPTY